MALKETRPGVWYDDQAEGSQISKLIFKDRFAPAKATAADGRVFMVEPSAARVLVASIVESSTLCPARMMNGNLCGRKLPCRYHSQ